MKIIKKTKKVLPVLLGLILILTPFGGLKAFAYSGGLLNGKTINVGKNDNSLTTTTTNITDDNRSTSYTLGTLIENNNTFYYNFPTPVNISSFRLDANGTTSYFIITLKDKDNNIIDSFQPPNSSGVVFNHTVNNVSKISVSDGSTMRLQVYDFDVFGEIVTVPPMNVTNLQSNNITDASFDISWVAPKDYDVTGYNIYLNNSLVQENIDKGTLSYSLNGLSPETQYDVKVTAYNQNGENTGTTITVKTNSPPDVTPPSNVSNLVATPTDKSVSLNWTNPPESDFAKVLIYKDGVYQKAVTAAEGSSAFFNSLQPETDYTFLVTSVDFTGNESIGSSIKVKTLPLQEVKNIKNLNLDSKYDRVKLSWDLPDSEYFHHVKIYRKVNQDKSFLDQIFGFAATTAYAADTTDGYSPMFETNGTYWIDYTVTPETNYQYKLTSVNTDDRESQGVVVSTTTPKEPKPQIDGAAFSTNSTGDYDVSWNSPTTGKVKIFVGGQLYKEVDAAQKGYSIPKDSMKYTVLGDPDVKLQPVSALGTEGDMTRAPGTIDQAKIPFTVKDLIDSGNGLLWLLGPFVLLALSFLIVPKFRRIIVAAFRGKSGKNGTDPDIPKERRTGEEKQPIDKEKREKPLRTEKEQKEPRTARIKAEKEQRTERIEKQPRAIKESRFRARQQRTERRTSSPREPKAARKLKRQPRPERETRPPREPRERRRG